MMANDDARWRLTVTGTDTDVGKSVVTASLAAGLVSLGLRVRAAKPVASGVRSGQAGVDADLLALGAGHEASIWQTFEAPVSPHRAARSEGWSGSARGLRRWLQALTADVVLVEAAGGWLVPLLPLDDGSLYEVVDLARDVGGPVLVVAGNKLGVLNHARLTVRAVRDDGLRVLAVVLNEGGGATADASVRTNLDDLRELLDVPVVSFPRLSSLSREELTRAGEQLVRALALFPPTDVDGRE